MEKKNKPFTGIVLAADRGPEDPVARAAHAPCKSLVSIAGRPMVLRVLDALAEAREINTRIVCGPARNLISQVPEFNALLEKGEIQWIPHQATPSASTYHALNSLSNDALVLVTTADHAFLSPEIIDYFCLEARNSEHDVLVGLASHEQVLNAFPETKRTASKFRDGGYCSCNLFAFLSARARRAAEFWQQCEGNRKKPWKIVRTIGWGVVSQYLLGRLSLNEVLKKLSWKMGLSAGAIILPFPEAAVDVDSAADLRLVEETLRRQVS